MDFFERLVMKLSSLFQKYCNSCLVQLLRIRFQKLLHFTVNFFLSYIPCLLPPGFRPPPPVYPLPRLPACLHPHLPASLPQPPVAPP